MSIYGSKEENLGYAGFLFKKTIQTNPIRKNETLSSNEFLDSNIFIYINKKIKELKDTTGRNYIPKEFFHDLVLPSKLKKSFSKNNLMATTLTGKTARINEQNNDLIKKGNKILAKSKFVKKSKPIKVPEKEIRNILYERIPDKKFEGWFNQFKRETLVRDLEKMVLRDETLLDDSFKRKNVIKEVLCNYEYMDDKDEYIMDVCKTQNITLSSLLEIEESFF